MAKAADQFTEGQAVSCDNTTHNVGAPGTGKFPIGVAVAAAATSDTKCLIRLSGIPTVAA